jgi:peroxiredoxin
MRRAEGGNLQGPLIETGLLFPTSLYIVEELPMRAHWFKILGGTLIASILAINLALIRYNRELREELDSVIHKEFHPGDSLKSFGGVSLQGSFTKVSFAEKPKKTVLIAFSTGCAACKANLGNWLRLSSQLDRSEWDVVWLSRDPKEMTSEFSRKHGIRDEVLAEFSCTSYDYLGLRMVPRMIVVGRDGEVKKIWNGELQKSQWEEVFDYFQAKPMLASKGR